MICKFYVSRKMTNISFKKASKEQNIIIAISDHLKLTFM